MDYGTIHFNVIINVRDSCVKRTSYYNRNLSRSTIYSQYDVDTTHSYDLNMDDLRYLDIKYMSTNSDGLKLCKFFPIYSIEIDVSKVSYDISAINPGVYSYLKTTKQPIVHMDIILPRGSATRLDQPINLSILKSMEIGTYSVGTLSSMEYYSIRYLILRNITLTSKCVWDIAMCTNLEYLDIRSGVSYDTGILNILRDCKFKYLRLNQYDLDGVDMIPQSDVIEFPGINVDIIHKIGKIKPAVVIGFGGDIDEYIKNNHPILIIFYSTETDMPVGRYMEMSSKHRDVIIGLWYGTHDHTRGFADPVGYFIGLTKSYYINGKFYKNKRDIF